MGFKRFICSVKGDLSDLSSQWKGTKTVTIKRCWIFSLEMMKRLVTTVYVHRLGGQSMCTTYVHVHCRVKMYNYRHFARKCCHNKMNCKECCIDIYCLLNFSFHPSYAKLSRFTLTKCCPLSLCPAKWSDWDIFFTEGVNGACCHVAIVFFLHYIHYKWHVD